MEISITPMSGLAQAPAGLPNYDGRGWGPSVKVAVRISLHGASLPFDTVLLRLRGTVRTQVGPQWAVHKVLDLAAECHSTDFAMQTAHGDTIDNFAAVVTFVDDVKASAVVGDGRVVILPNLSLSGEALVSKHTAITDQHRLSGSCITETWTSADFFSGGRLQYHFETPGDLSCPPSAVTLLSRAVTPFRGLGMKARTHSGKLKLGKSNSSGNVSVCIMEKQLQQSIQHTQKGAKSLTVPVSLTLDGDALKMVEDDGVLATNVLVRWSKILAFRASPTNVPPPVIGDHGVVVEKTSFSRPAHFSLPPCYEPKSNVSQRESCIAGFLHIPVPDGLDMSTFQSSLLSVYYELELKIVFQPRSGKSGSSTTVKAKMPCVLE